MIRWMQIAAVVLDLGIVGLWVALGANTGWTKTLVPVPRVDPVTDIAYTEYEKRFVPGLDFVVVGAGLTAVLFAASVIIPKLHKQKNS